ncbi:MAG: glycoside hydrolase family 44 protein [Acidobacteriaceae bacterium]
MKLKWAAVSGALVCALMAGCGGSSGSGGGGGTQQPTVTGVTVSMAASSLATGSTDQATATVTGTGAYSSAVTWSLTPTSGGAISTGGVFTPSAPGSVTVTATSVEDTTKSGTATVTVTRGPKIVINPLSPTVTIGTSLQFTATVSGETNTGVSWSVADATGGTGDAGTITSAGLYQSPYPAPSMVTVTATSAADSSLSTSTTVTLNAPATATGPVLTVDTGNVLHPINKWVYGVNAYLLDNASATLSGTTLTRWGGDDTERYNYLTNMSNSASDYYFFNGPGSSGMLPAPTGSGTSFTGTGSYVSAANALGVTVLGTTPQIGWVANSTNGACGYPEATFPGQQSYVSNCGNGVYANGSNGCTQSGGCPVTITGGASALQTEAELTSVPAAVPATTAAELPTVSGWTTSWATGTFVGKWVNSIVNASGYGAGNSGKGVAIWDLGNEPAWWDAVQRDVHQSPSTYDEVTEGGISTALAIKKVDSTALVAGPIIDYWWNYFYSKADIESGWGTPGAAPCYEPWSNPTDREAHNGVPMIEYYLQQMAAASATYNTRLLDILDIHGYFAGSYNGNSVAFTTAGDTGEQAVREDSVRALWDPTYTNSNYPQPNYKTDSNYTTSCNTPLQAPQAIPMLETWVAKDYPGTKTAIDEYNWGGLESINGAVTQADVLGVFGQYGLDMGSFWPTTNYVNQGPGNYAFAMYRDYDLKNDGAVFGDQALASCSTTAALSTACVPIAGTTVNPAVESGQGKLAVYGALRSTDNAITVMVINKTWGPLTSSLTLTGVSSSGTASVYQYSNANLTSIVAEPGVTVATAAAGTPPGIISSYTFPAQSITLFVIPQ